MVRINTNRDRPRHAIPPLASYISLPTVLRMRSGLMDHGQKWLNMIIVLLLPNQNAPLCWGHYEGETWPWTGCQAKQVNWTDEDKLFTFSLDMVEEDRDLRGIFQQNSIINPFSLWMLCGINGSCLDASPLAMLQGRAFGTVNFSCKVNEIRQYCCNNPGSCKDCSCDSFCSGSCDSDCYKTVNVYRSCDKQFSQ